MSLDPQIVAAIVATAGGFAGRLFDRFTGTKASEPEEEAIQNVMEGSYSSLRKELTDNCVIVLVYLENGENRAAMQIRRYLYPKVKEMEFGSEAINMIESELEYRMKFLALLGLITPIGGGREFAITPLGNGFITKAKSVRDYYSVFWPR